MEYENYIGLEHEEFERRIDAVVEEMRALNISSIVIIQDSVEIGVGNAPTRAEKEFLANEYNKCFGTAPRSDDA
jgi:hypothetical protein